MPTFANTSTIVIDAPAPVVHAYVNDFHEWTKWSPWEGLDPDLKRTYSGAASGAGAAYAWEGNKKTGSGTMAILGSQPGRIDIDLTFTAPFKGDFKVDFTFVPEGDATRVNWTMAGQRNPVLAVMGKLVMDRMIAKDYAKGLDALKALAEG